MQKWRRLIPIMGINLRHLEQTLGSKIGNYVWISYKFIRNLYEKGYINTNEPETINRHWLLHGRSDYETNDLNCIRLFSVGSCLRMIVGKDKENN